MLYTRTGDTGHTSSAIGERIRKDDLQLHAIGSVDELDALLGVIRSFDDCCEQYKAKIIVIQQKLYQIKAELSGAKTISVQHEDVNQIEEWIDDCERGLEPLAQFILPGGTVVAAQLQYARTVCRTAERWIVAVCKDADHHQNLLQYINRLSDYFFALARVVNKGQGGEELYASP